MSSDTLSALHAGLDRVGLAAIQDPEDNRIYSPLSTLMATGLLVFTEEDEALRRCLLEWWGVNSETTDDEWADVLRWMGITWRAGLGNRIYWQYVVHEMAEISTRCAEYLEKRIGVPILVTTFPDPAASIVNEGIVNATNGMIKACIPANLSSESRVIANAVYLKRSWGFKIKSHRKCREWLLPDEELPIFFFVGRGNFRYASDDSYHYLALPYRKYEDSVMEVYMTKHRSKLPLGLTVPEMNSLRSKAKSVKMTVFVPNWEATSEIDVMSDLASIGYLPPSLVFLNQTAKVKVDCAGTEAAAATVCGSEDCLTKEPRMKKPFYVNRPFIYTIRCGSVTEFIGYLYRPEQDTESGEACYRYH